MKRMLLVEEVTYHTQSPQTNACHIEPLMMSQADNHMGV